MPICREQAISRDIVREREREREREQLHEAVRLDRCICAEESAADLTTEQLIFAVLLCQ